MRALAPLLAALLILPLAAGLLPTDADAGTPGDAGDVAQLAKPVTPGTFTGRVLGGADQYDWFSFPATKGQLIRAVATSTAPGAEVRVTFHGPATGSPMVMAGEMLGYDSAQDGEALHGIAFETGTWAIRVEAATVPGPAAPYVVELAVTTPTSGGVHATGDAWAAIEAELGPGDLHVVVRFEAGPDGGHAHDGQVTTESNGALHGIYGGTRRATGSTVRVEGTAVGLPIATSLGGGSVGGSIAGPTSFSGTLRLTGWTTLEDARIVLAYAHTGTTLAQASQSGATTLVLEEPANDDQGISTPIHNELPARTYTLDVASRFLGSFNLDGEAGHAIDPLGVRHDVEPFCQCLQSRPDNSWMLGTWTFHVGPTSTLGINLQHPYLVGAFVPALGVY